MEIKLKTKLKTDMKKEIAELNKEDPGVTPQPNPEDEIMKSEYELRHLCVDVLEDEGDNVVLQFCHYDSREVVTVELPFHLIGAYRYEVDRITHDTAAWRSKLLAQRIVALHLCKDLLPEHIKDPSMS